MDNSDIKVVILCGGMGTRLREETEFKPKPLVEIGGKPILWHIMKIYAYYGFKNFVLCLGYKGEMIKNYFLNYEVMNNDLTLELGKNKMEYHNSPEEDGWRITLANTGNKALTGARVKKIEKYIENDKFMLTYGDGVSNIDINELLKFHLSHSKIGTVTGVRPSSRFGELLIKKDMVEEFSEKPQVEEGYINGGFFVFQNEFFDYLNENDDCNLEREPLEKLTLDKELMVYKHKSFWHCMDTYRDTLLLNELWNLNPEWKIWRYR
jgi:glucose-1-phosphate cytidylyltransferase